MSYTANIMVVDDEKGMLNTLVGILEDEGHRIYACSNGTQAIKRLSADTPEEPIDLVISDLKLPDISGLIIQRHLKKTYPETAFILITAHATLESALEAVNQGAFAYQVKPLDMDALLHTVRNALTQQRLRAENRDLLEKVQQSEIKYRTLVEKASDGIFMVEPVEGRFIEVNPMMVKLSGKNREDLLDMALPMLQPEAEQSRITEMLRHTLEHGYATTNDLTFQRSDGEEIFIDLNSSLMEYQDGKAVLGIARDITRRKAAEEALRENSRLAAIGELAAGVAHEINNPLTVIAGFSEILLSKGDLPQQAEHRLQGINSEARRAGKIVQNLLSFARRHEPEKRPVDVTSILERALDLKSAYLSVNNIQVTSQWAGDLPMPLVDEHQMLEVVLNIISNAEQAMAEAHGGGELIIGASTVGNKVRISIADDGPGIPAEHHHKIFDPFFTTKEVGQGTGLGLSICYGIIQQHGGEIWVESVPGEGATFHIELPIADQDGDVEPPEPEPDLPSFNLEKVLVVDDEPGIRSLMAEALSPSCRVVDLAADGYEGWRKVQSGTYDCILLDLKVPGMCGQDLYRLIKQSDQELARKVIFVTGDIVSPDTRSFITATGNLSLSKPFKLDDLRRQIRKLQAMVYASQQPPVR